MSIILIAAIDSNRAIGLNGDQLAYISQDLKHFKETTLGCPVIMGRRTNEALPKRRLPGRRNIVLTRSDDFALQVRDIQEVEIAHSIDEALLLTASEPRTFVIGGEQIYKAFMPFADTLILTHIETAFSQADAYFPPFDGWKQKSRSESFTDPKTGLSFYFETLVRP